MMMITAMILATGPSIDSRIDCSGASHGMDEPRRVGGRARASGVTATAAAACADGGGSDAQGVTDHDGSPVGGAGVAGVTR